MTFHVNRLYYSMNKNMNVTDAGVPPVTYRFIYPTCEEASLTNDQRTALEKVAERWEMTTTVEVSPMFGGAGAVIVNVGTMYLAVEPDGYTHS